MWLMDADSATASLTYEQRCGLAEEVVFLGQAPAVTSTLGSTGLRPESCGSD